ncbi:MAG: ABC transporter substrate-binding protein, partial [Thermomicrobiales bacterium]
MSDRSLTPAALTRRAIQTAEDGNRADARQLLAEALSAEPGYEPAWLWYAHLAENDGERKFCLQRAAALNEESAAKAALPKLANVEASEPGPLHDILDPEAPPSVFAMAESEGPRISRVWLGLALLALLGLFAGILYWNAKSGRNGKAPIHIAYVAGLSTENKAPAIEMLDSIQLEFDRVNATGGIGGRPIELTAFDDENNADKAKSVAEQIVQDGSFLAVIGHRTSNASQAAGVVYAAAGMPAITPSATANAITASNPWYFRTVFSNGRQGVLMAAAVEHLLNEDSVVLIGGSSVYGQSLSDSFANAFEGASLTQYELADEAGIPDLVTEVKSGIGSELIVLAMDGTVAQSLIISLRDAGITNRIIGGDSLGTDRFLQGFTNHPMATEKPGFYTDGMIASSPLFMDSLSADALRWSQEFEARYGSPPSWYGATAGDAALALAHALDVSQASMIGSADESRLAIRNALAVMDSPANSVPGILGRIWFDGTRSVPRNIAIGIASNQLYSSAPVQFSAYKPSGDSTLKEDIANEDAIDVDGTALLRQRIVFTGVNVNEVGELDLGSQTFNADFFIWFRYEGSDDATDVQFLNALDPSLSLGDPVRESKLGNETYRLYRVNATFKAQMEFRAFP